VHQQNREPLLARGPPVAVAKHLRARLNLKEPFFRRRQKVWTPQKISRKRLSVRAAQPTPGKKANRKFLNRFRDRRFHL
jgi:hypothetical protein